MAKYQIQVREKPCSLTDLFSSGTTTKYIVPLYQREYAWGDEEITQLLNDFYEAFLNYPAKSYHIGIVVIIRRSASFEGQLYELIDGQQRFTTLSILYRLIQEDLKHPIERKVFFENRPEAENFLNDFFQDAKTYNMNPWPFRNAMEIIRDFHYNDLSWETLLYKTIDINGTGTLMSFRDFILKQVKLFVVEMPITTDVSRYFEIMNNRGRQLEPHELLKAQLIQLYREENSSKSDDELEVLCRHFDDVWNILAHMNGHIEKYVHAFTTYSDSTELDEWVNLPLNSTEIDVNNTDELQSVINDFPNFLMQVLKQYCNWKNYDDEVVPLDDRQFKKTFDNILGKKKISATEFVGYIIRMRLKYDRYVVKAQFLNNEVKQWVIKRYPQSSYELINTFTEKYEQIVKLQSMLQVTYRSRRYKDWLQLILEQDDCKLSSSEEMIKLLTEYVRNRIKELCDNSIDSSSLLNIGLKTPHVVFNLIDYLMWLKEPGKDFIFTYRSSIEHHQPQDETYSENKNVDWKDTIGNLCLVYANENSSMSNHSPKEKLNQHGDWQSFPPKRRYMYQLTSEDDGWTEEKCKGHTEVVKNLLNAFLTQKSY